MNSLKRPRNKQDSKTDFRFVSACPVTPKMSPILLYDLVHCQSRKAKTVRLSRHGLLELIRIQLFQSLFDAHNFFYICTRKQRLALRPSYEVQ
jgi:hypothetical protein